MYNLQVTTLDSLIWCSMNQSKSKRELENIRKLHTDEVMLECIDTLIFTKDYAKKPYVIQYKVHQVETGYFVVIELRYFQDIKGEHRIFEQGKLKSVPVMLNIFETEELANLEMKRLKSIYLFFNGSNFNDPDLAKSINRYEEVYG
jgi:hypothetical protein